MTIESGHNYKLINVKGGTCLDLAGSSNANAAIVERKTITGFRDNGGNNQKWHFSHERRGPHNDGWILESVGYKGLYLGVEQSPSDGVSVVAVPQPFWWDIRQDHENPEAYRLFVPESNFNLDLSNHGDPNDGTHVELWGQWKGTNQTWNLEKV